MSLTNLIEKEISATEDNVVIADVPEDKRTDSESVRNLNQCIANQEYIDRIALIVEETRRAYSENPEQARVNADAVLTHMGLVEDGKVKNQIVTNTYAFYK